MKKSAKIISALRRKRFLLQFQRYLENYLKRPGFRNREKPIGSN